jgi:hypothetical protein
MKRYVWILGLFALSGLLVASVVTTQAQSVPPDWLKVYLPIVMAPTGSPPAPGHAGIASYNGPQTCIACHAEEAESALHSEHVQWAGKWKEVNTYCTAPEPADYACLSCHAATGKVTNLTVNDVDCLICHQDNYQRSLQPLTNDLTVVDWQGNTKIYHTPVKNLQGNYTFQPRFDLMAPGTTMVELARTVHLPTRATCLRCHATLCDNLLAFGITTNPLEAIAQCLALPRDQIIPDSLRILVLFVFIVPSPAQRHDPNWPMLAFFFREQNNTGEGMTYRDWFVALDRVRLIHVTTVFQCAGMHPWLRRHIGTQQPKR